MVDGALLGVNTSSAAAPVGALLEEWAALSLNPALVVPPTAAAARCDACVCDDAAVRAAWGEACAPPRCFRCHKREAALLSARSSTCTPSTSTPSPRGTRRRRRSPPPSSPPSRAARSASSRTRGTAAGRRRGRGRLGMREEYALRHESRSAERAHAACEFVSRMQLTRCRPMFTCWALEARPRPSLASDASVALRWNYRDRRLLWACRRTLGACGSSQVQPGDIETDPIGKGPLAGAAARERGE